MTEQIIQNLVVVFIHFVIGTVFLLASLMKALEFSQFQYSLKQSILIPKDWVNGLSWFLIVLEGYLGFAFVFSWHPRISALIAILTLLGFTTYIFILLKKDSTRTCGCFGSRRKVDFKTALARNSFLLVSSLVSFFVPSQLPSPPLIFPIFLIFCIYIAANWVVRLEKKKDTLPKQIVFNVERRTFLNRLTFSILGLLGISLLRANSIEASIDDAPCWCTQTYNHWEPYCGTAGCSVLKRRHHVWTRQCDRCNCSCFTAWGNGIYTCEACNYECDTITPNCGGSPYNGCNPCVCS